MKEVVRRLDDIDKRINWIYIAFFGILMAVIGALWALYAATN
jgi:hypothetical protein